MKSQSAVVPASPAGSQLAQRQPGSVTAKWMKQFLPWLIKTSWAIPALFLAVGFLVFSSGLNNPFMGDDSIQIVNNPTVHSIKNIGSFFVGGSGYSGNPNKPLTGVFYRPIMTTTFSVIYSVFGPNPLPFHLLQLLLHIAAAYLCYLILKRFLKSPVALLLAIIFLVHPINSQSVFAIANMQEPLYMTFGLLGLWVLIRFKGLWATAGSILCLALSLFSKETGILFFCMSVIYLFLFDSRLRLVIFSGSSLIFGIGYAIIRTLAVGFAHNPRIAPIDSLGLISRLASFPAQIILYVTTFIFPVHIASRYYWVYSYGSFPHFWVPLFFGLTLLILALYVGAILKEKNHKSFLTYLFFGLWLGIGLVFHSQILPLDQTASDAWFYFSVIGLLGMLGASTDLINRKWLGPIGVVTCLIIVLLGARTYLRGFDWQSEATLSSIDVKISQNDFIGDYELAYYSLANGHVTTAENYANESVSIYPTVANTDTLARAYIREGNYARAMDAFQEGLNLHEPYFVLYDDLASLSLYYGNPQRDARFYANASIMFPNDPTILLAEAVAKYRIRDIVGAKTAITQAHRYSNSTLINDVYFKIMHNESLG